MDNEKVRIQFYTVPHVIKMLPFIKTYCKDIRELYAELIANFKEIDKINKMPRQVESKVELELLGDKKDQLIQRWNRYVDELEEMGIELCDFKKGALDLPMIGSVTKGINSYKQIFICVTENTTEDTIMCHDDSQGHDDCIAYNLD